MAVEAHISGRQHQCLLYDGPPSRHLPKVVSVIRQKLSENYRCFYLNSPPMVAAVRSYMTTAGIDVAREMEKTRLMFSSEQNHLLDGRFDIDRMMGMLADGLAQALEDGFAGFWATGDMTWEFGPEKDFSKLLEYEWRLEEFMREHPQLGGICQYHTKMLPREAMLTGLAVHPSLFINEGLSVTNPHCLVQDSFDGVDVSGPVQQAALTRFLRVEELN
jgi:hypothetical protein